MDDYKSYFHVKDAEQAKYDNGNAIFPTDLRSHYNYLNRILAQCNSNVRIGPPASAGNNRLRPLNPRVDIDPKHIGIYMRKSDRRKVKDHSRFEVSLESALQTFDALIEAGLIEIS